MPFDDDTTASPSGAQPADTARARRRSSRPWSNPGAGLDTPVTEAEWSRTAAAPPRSNRPPAAPPLGPGAGAPGAVDLSTIANQLAGLQAQVGALQSAGANPDTALVTGDELAAAIEGLGAVLGGGMATLLTEHRNLLARDVSQAADRILEEMGTRLRAATTQTVDGVEERIRPILTKVLGDLGDQLELKLDKVQADLAGLRAVMLEIPDQAAVTDRLDSLNDRFSEVASGAKVGPAVTNAVEATVTGPLEQIDANLHQIVDVVRELLEERLPEDLAASIAGAVSTEPAPGLPDAATLEALTSEMQALRRRISLRTGAEDGTPPAPPQPSAATDDAADDDEIAIAPKAPKAPAARRAAATPAPRPRGRRSRQID